MIRWEGAFEDEPESGYQMFCI